MRERVAGGVRGQRDMWAAHHLPLVHIELVGMGLCHVYGDVVERRQVGRVVFRDHGDVDGEEGVVRRHHVGMPPVVIVVVVVVVVLTRPAGRRGPALPRQLRHRRR